MKSLPVLLAAALSLAPAASAADEKQLTLPEAKAEFAKQDAALNAVWERARKELEPGEFAMLKESQRGWVAWRDDLAASPTFSGAPDGDESQRKQTRQYFSLAAGFTADRTAWLKGRLAKQPDDTMTGTWTDSYNGTIDIVEKNKKLYFNISVVRGTSAHLGLLNGIAQWNETIGWFSDKDKEKGKTDETNLAFVLDGTALNLTGANTRHYHGQRAYFDGTYIKTGKLSAKREAEVIKAAEIGGQGQE